MAEGITVRVLGDYGPFSRMGKSIGYLVTIRGASYLIDCGTPLFQQIGGHGLKNIRGLIITHCHDDHKRWFSDLALFNMYAPDFNSKLFLLTSEHVNDELKRSSAPALERSLSFDAKSIVDISYDSYVDFRALGPRPKYRICKRNNDDGVSSLFVEGPDRRPVGPDVAKIVISAATGLPRMLFRDQEYNEWVEPEAFYSFNSEVFYEKDRNVYKDPEGFVIEAFNAPVWHGLPNIGIRFSTENESLIFSSDTVHDVELWKSLAFDKRSPKYGMSKERFDEASVLSGDINDFIERCWSKERYEDAMHSFDSGVAIHDISSSRSVVHTDYVRLRHTVLDKERVILTHSPDRITSEWVLSRTDKLFRVINNRFYEAVGDKLYLLNADIYHKESGRYYVGYRNPEGLFSVFESDGLLFVSSEQIPGRFLFRVDLYEDISGRYFPKLDNDDEIYFERRDGMVEKISFSDSGSRGEVVFCHREKLSVTV